MDAETLTIIGKFVLVALLVVLGFIAEMKDKDSEGYFIIAFFLFVWFVN